MKIRKGTEEDLPKALELIKELAIYEKAGGEVLTTVEMMKIDGFGSEAIYEFYVAENEENKVVGIALFYYRYSTWKGRRLYLEDLIVTEKERSKGYGKMLMDKIMEHARHNNCTGVMWQVLDWNIPSIEFYEKVYGAKLDGEWINCSVEL